MRQQSSAHLRQDLKGCAWLVRLLPELAEGPVEALPPWTLTPEQERRLLFKAVGRFLANLAGQPALFWSSMTCSGPGPTRSTCWRRW
jgi:hypothetical protein